MICQKKRFYQKKYCSSDFQHYITLYKQSIINENKFTQIDGINKNIVEFQLLCNIKINNFDIESGGELLRAGSTANIITYYQSQPVSNTNLNTVYEDIKSNCKNWFVKYFDHKYQILDIDLVDGKNFYNQIFAQRIS
jgi:hypothetical protein